MTEKDLVYLVNTGNDPGMSSIANDNSFPALGILALGTWLEMYLPEIQLIVRDGGVIGNETIIDEISRLRPYIVGISVLSTSYQASLKIARAAKEAGAFTVFGNDQAAQLSHKILRNRPCVDFIVGSEYGERPFELLIRALRGESISLAEIPDLTYRDAHGIKGFDYEVDKAKLSITSSVAYKMPFRKKALDIFPLVNRKLYSENHWEIYLKNYTNRFGKLHRQKITGVTTMNRARGCSRSQEKIKCKHCDMLLDISFSSPEVFWHEVQHAHEQINANVFYEVCDSFSSFPSLIRDIVMARPKNLEFSPEFFIYAQALDLVKSSSLIENLKEMGVSRVFIGLESGSDRPLKHMKGNQDSIQVNYEALRLLKKHGIHVYGSFVLGTDAETRASLAETVLWVKRIIDEELICDVEAQPILPLPYNYYGKKLALSNALTAEESDSDWPWDVDAIAKRYIDKFSGVSYTEAVETAYTIRDYAESSGLNFGSAFGSEAGRMDKISKDK